MIKDRFKNLSERWFLTEPALFTIFCSHPICVNERLHIPLRVGKGIIEYNPTVLSQFSDDVFEKLIKIEMIRLILKHPYERMPAGCSNVEMKMASDMVLSSFYTFRHIQLYSPATFGLISKKYYEWYIKQLHKRFGYSVNGDRLEMSSLKTNLQIQSVNSKNCVTNSIKIDEYESELTALWEDDANRKEALNDLIENVKDWGTLAGSISEIVRNKSNAYINYKKILTLFYRGILSSKRIYTRMRPNRRYGSEQMGYRYNPNVRLLFAVDTSGSISSQTLQNFIYVIKHFFRYGIDRLELLLFDSKIKLPVTLITKHNVKNDIEIQGRGGTSFQPIFDFLVNHKNYDGVIILTDGYAPRPNIHKLPVRKLLWVCTDRQNYLKHKNWMGKLGHVCFIDLNNTEYDK